MSFDPLLVKLACDSQDLALHLRPGLSLRLTTKAIQYAGLNNYPFEARLQCFLGIWDHAIGSY